VVIVKRRGFLIALAGAAVAPATAGAKFHQSAIPHSPKLPKNYGPYDANPYYHPSVLKKSQVDELIWPAVKRINESDWVWTLESCQGNHAWSKYPLIRLVVHNGNVSQMLGLLHRSAPYTRFTEKPGPNHIEVYRHVQPPLPGWFEARVLVKGIDPIAVWDRFAEAVNTGRVQGRSK